jgi:hypothetical protein
MALLKSNTSLQTQGKLLKTILIKNVKIITLAMLVCDLLGVKTDSIDYTNKLMMITSLMTIFGSGLWAANGNNLGKQKTYIIPNDKNIEKL